MKGETGERRRHLLWALPASLILHALIAAFLVYGLPRPEQQPVQQEQPVNVAIVPPPEKPKPKPAPKPPEPTPEKKAEKPPEQKPPPEPPKPPDDQVLKRVFQYGQKDTGPEKSLDGSSAKPSTPSPAKDEAVKPPVAPTPTPTQPAPAATPQQKAEPSKPDEKPATAAPDEKPAQSEEKQATEETDKQQPDKQEPAPQPAEKQAVVTPKPLAAEIGDKPAPPASTGKAKPKAKPAKTMTFKPARAFKAPIGNAGRSNPTNDDVAGSPIYSGLPGVRKLYSQGATGNAFATSSMENVPRGQRVATLCGNVLSRELQSADYTVKWVPTITLDKGNVLNPPQAAFSTRNAWYNLNFRCEVDADATRVLSFNFRVGSLVPPGEWASRGFTKYRLN
ncbi:MULTISPECIES: DUF930 domain-containing protein [Mesorhizobium]|uniref:DUF930 domain-containing protein n=4 Tax=Phyllobacteriaceae TaxID=69277 RepID=UPI000FCC373B|nr:MULTISPECIES: DUF930 domain-containing protein [Mesorhizobium]RWO72815.1 MAG: DUF930 domain-containing protein [Mesorhizobium sp.]MCF6127126.1 DUF930 domain-containing protein [Mesorhizobium ciceri]MCQ8818170.1 DUF930 domain-containing protein [Mesorhizobium sp. SEMIA396]RUX71065.1 DUF930 domain-containing protein [Mesorhizobium sp. M7A.F.Ca.CA.004.08.2.1]RUX93398.1 DUF930 domain-containing protein [Mesorhizobium sp. M7A.F.Ca.CA.004.04.1.1]